MVEDGHAMATVETTPSGEAQRTLRADARRNRERILAAASAAFAEEGFDVGVAAIAKRAGVGTGTLFRHFPTKRDLEVAVVLERAAAMRANLRASLEQPDPWEAFATLMTGIVEQTACDRCLGQASKPELQSDPRIRALGDEMLAGVEAVLRRGREAGVLRRDVSAEDIPVLASAIGTTMERFGNATPDLWRRYLGVVLDGLRADGAVPLQPGPPGPGVLSDTCSP